MNNTESRKWLRYWRNSLADAERLIIDNSIIEKGIFVEIESSFPIKLPDKKTKKLLKQGKRQDEDLEDINSVFVAISPFVLKPNVEFGKQKQAKYNVYPFWIPARLKHDGLLVAPLDNDIRYCWFDRNVIEPHSRENSPVITSVDKIDEQRKFWVERQTDTWKSLWKQSHEFFENCTSECYDTIDIEGYDTVGELTVVVPAKSGFNDAVLNLCEQLLEDDKSLPSLLQEVATCRKAYLKEKPDEKSLFLKGNHYGSMNREFPLSKSQRISANLFFDEGNGRILAVNGPPGTGKTTLLHSIIANEMVCKAHQKGEPSLIMASSKNNQAITNIVESLAKNESEEPLENRWLPELKSLGLYMTASGNSEGYQCMNKNHEGFFTHIESIRYWERAREKYLKQADKFTNGKHDTIEEAVEAVYNQLDETVRSIDKALSMCKKFVEIEELLLPYNSLEELKDSLNQKKKDLATLDELYKSIRHFEVSFRKLRNQRSFWQKYLQFIPKVKELNCNQARSHFRDAPTKLRQSINDYGNEEQILTTINDLLDELEKENKELNKNIDELESQGEEVLSVIEHWEKWNEDWLDNYGQRLEQLYEATGDEYQHLPPSEDLNVKLDISLRYEAYLWALHYWEGRYLEDLEEKNTYYKNKNEKGQKYKRKLLRYAKVAPCFISTFQSLPDFARFWPYSEDKEHYEEKFYDELFDLLIVDEAGQVEPEVGGPSFALAKEALVVGDIQQIPPIPSIPSPIDEGNLRYMGFKKRKSVDRTLISSYKETGLLASNGSIMKVAQKCSPYQISRERGTMLKEHRRCLDEIIYFSNRYVYDRTLIPKVGSKNKDCISNLPPVGYVNIEGKQQSRMGSWANMGEAEAIAEWLLKNRERLIENYKGGLEELVGVVTPFRQQTIAINKAIKEKVGTKGITVGTIHSLQGAERPIVIFSSVNTEKQGSYFFDKYYMLNVALSRAKHHFLVFGKMGIFNPNTNTASGNLAKILFEDSNNEVDNGFFYDLKNHSVKQSNRLSKLSQHRGSLRKSFSVANEELIIVSPFISTNALNADNIPQLIENAVDKNIKVKIYTDKFLDRDYERKKLKASSRKGRENIIRAGAELYEINGIHSKSIAIDDKILIEGSFNWLSAVRSKNSQYERHEVSHVIKEKEDVGRYIKDLKEELKNGKLLNEQMSIS